MFILLERLISYTMLSETTEYFFGYFGFVWVTVMSTKIDTFECCWEFLCKIEWEILFSWKYLKFMNFKGWSELGNFDLQIVNFIKMQNWNPSVNMF